MIILPGGDTAEIDFLALMPDVQRGVQRVVKHLSDGILVQVERMCKGLIDAGGKRKGAIVVVVLVLDIQRERPACAGEVFQIVVPRQCRLLVKRSMVEIVCIISIAAVVGDGRTEEQLVFD